ncbi:hypothetical protein ALC53_13888, partial [Atta colombica]
RQGTTLTTVETRREGEGKPRGLLKKFYLVGALGLSDATERRIRGQIPSACPWRNCSSFARVREKRTSGSRKYAVEPSKVPWARKIRIELLCTTPPDLFDNPATRRSGIIRANRLYSDHTSNSVEADTSTSRTRVAANSDRFWNPPIQRNIIPRSTDFRRNDTSPVA